MKVGIQQLAAVGLMVNKATTKGQNGLKAKTQSNGFQIPRPRTDIGSIMIKTMHRPWNCP
jgi:hypothetical protein